jgi:hypothetical protein
MLREPPLICCIPAVGAGEESDVDHGFVEVAAYQETLLIMVIFGIAILAMIWVAFRRWLQHQEKMDRLIADQTAERSAQFGAHMERVEARLKAVEQLVIDEARERTAEIEAVDTNGQKPIA